MNLEQFRLSLHQAEPPSQATDLLLALWTEAKGEWTKSDWTGAHEIVQAHSGEQAARVHAYLHRREGDHSNARYWYTRGGIKPFEGELEDEWDEIVVSLLPS